MLDVAKALAIAAGLMLTAILLITGINFTVVKRGELRFKHGSVAQAERGRDAGFVPRRKFLSWMGLAWTAFASSTAVTLGATGRFMFPNVLFEPPSTFKAGAPGAIQPGEVDERFKETYGVWLVKDIEPATGNLIIYALSDICTHLGCIPNWLQGEQKFKCPCHGSGYYKSGINFEGPTPRPLERFEISLAEDGQILVDKSHKFQQEKGEWSDPRSFLPVAS